MKINLLTDAPRHNLALMKISAYHKAKGDEVLLNMPLVPCDQSYASWLFTWSDWYKADVVGGTGYDGGITRLSAEIQSQKPDYDLFPKLDYSLGYTWEWCPRKCPWCVIPMNKPPREHHSIYRFINPRFSKICLLNNNTFSDPRWRQTFLEIWDAGLEVIDQNGYDLRLLDEEKAEALKKTQFVGSLYFSWDNIEDEAEVRRGLELIKRVGIKHNMRIYVLVGYPEGQGIVESDIYRCQVIADYGITPYAMVYNNNSTDSRLWWFRRMCNRTFAWRKLGFQKAWEEGYRSEKRHKRRY